MTTPKSLLLSAMLVLVLVPLAGCAATLSGKLVDGQVLEEGTNKPIPGAIVVVLWKGTIGTIGHGSTVCYHVETATSNEQGRYQTPAWKKPSPYGDIAHRQWVAMAYKPGYELAGGKKGEVVLKAFNGAQEERLKYLRRINRATSCGSAGESEKNLYSLRKAVYEEAKQIAKTDFEKYVAVGFEQDVNSLLLPPGTRISMLFPHREKSELLKAIEDNNVARARALLVGDADPNDRANDGATMLMTAIRYGRSEIAMLLLENGADPNATTFDDQNQTAMDQLIYRNQDRVVAYAGKIAALMIQRGYDVAHCDVSGKTALEKATQYGTRSAERNAEIVKALKEHAMRDKR